MSGRYAEQGATLRGQPIMENYPSALRANSTTVPRVVSCGDVIIVFPQTGASPKGGLGPFFYKKHAGACTESFAFLVQVTSIKKKKKKKKKGEEDDKKEEKRKKKRRTKKKKREETEEAKEEEGEEEKADAREEEKEGRETDEATAHRRNHSQRRSRNRGGEKAGRSNKTTKKGSG